MDDFSSDKEEKIKLAFSKIKEDINNLKDDFNALKSIISKQQDLLESFIAEIAKNRQVQPENGGFKGFPEPSSTGNEGVQTNKQTNNQTNKQTQTKQTNTSLLQLSSIKKDVLNKFGVLPKREFLIFLTIYQMEEDKGSVSYSDIAQHLKLSESGVRHYVFNLIKKGAPIQKKRVNNKLTLLSLFQEFKEFNLKKELVDLYLHLDTHQKTLTDDYSHF